MAIGMVKGLNVAADAPPVGFVWKSASPISPAAIFAGTTWSQLKDRVIIPPANNIEDAKKRPSQFECYDWWFCHKAL